MTGTISSSDDLATAAEAASRERARYIDDLAGALYPASQAPPTESVIAGCRQALSDMVREAETRLLGHAGIAARTLEPTLGRLAESGAASEHRLVAALAAEVGLHTLLVREHADGTTGVVELRDRMASAAHRAIADTANRLDVQVAQRIRGCRAMLADLPVAIRHRLCWQIVAALEDHARSDSRALVRAGAAVLAEIGETDNVLHTGYKLAFLIEHHGDSVTQRLALRPDSAGTPLFVGMIAVRAQLAPDAAFATLLDSSVARLAILLRAAQIDQIVAGHIFGYYAPGQFAGHDIVDAIDRYEVISVVAAADHIARWQQADSDRDTGAADHPGAPLW